MSGNGAKPALWSHSSMVRRLRYGCQRLRTFAEQPSMESVLMTKPSSRAGLSTTKKAKQANIKNQAKAKAVEAEGPAGTGGGGPTASGGFNYQAAVTAIAMAHALRGLPLNWLEGLASDTALAIASETGQGGDDLRLMLADGSAVEVQVKKGLSKGGSLWVALMDLARPLAAGEAQYGVLVVSPGSSATVRVELAKDIIALGEGRDLKVGAVGAELVKRIRLAGWDPQAISGRLRVVTVAAAEFSDGDVRAALAHLAVVCATDSDALAAWDRFYRDAHVMIASRGRRDRILLAQVLRSAGLELRDDPKSPSGFLEQLCRWTLAMNNEFSILGVDRPLPIDAAYIQLDPYVETSQHQPAEDAGLAAAIARYHDWNERMPRRDSATSAPEALGRHFRRVVVVAGPGAGKSTLLCRVAASYAADGVPVLKASARSVAKRMSAGQGFEEALFDDALDGAPVPAAQARSVRGLPWTVLLDGLDESGQGQGGVIKGLKALAAGRPELRVIVATRPVGYQRAGLADWRHYSVPGIAEDDIDRVLAKILSHILAASDRRRDKLDVLVKEATRRSGSGKAALRTPMMLGLAAALFASGGSFGNSKTSFYRGVFELVGRAPAERVPIDAPAETIRNRFLDALGWKLALDPEVDRDALMAFAADVLKRDLNETALGSEAVAGRCLEYWQALGLVEDLHQGGERALAFVHKTFGEFAAGRFLAKAEPEIQTMALERSEADPGLREVVAFAAGEGLAPLVLAELQASGFEGDAGEQRLVQALDVLIDVRPQLAFSEAQPVVEAALRAAFDDRQGPVGLIGLKLRELARLYPGAISVAAAPLMGSNQNWTRLVGLAAGFVANPDQLSLTAWVEALAEIAGPARDAKGVRGFRSSDAAVDLVQAFALDIAKRLVAERSADEASEIFARVFGGDDLNRVGFIIEMERLLHGTDIQPWWRTGWETSMPRIDPNEVSRAIRQAFLALVRGLQPRDWDERPTVETGRPLYVLSAFMQLVDFGGTALPDLYPLEEFGDADDVRWLWCKLAVAAGLPLDALWKDAAEMEFALERFDGDALAAMFQHTFAVDIPPVDWGLQEAVEEELLEQALRRPSSLVVTVAVQIALATEVSTIRRLVKPLLLDGDDETLWAAAALSTRLPREEAFDLLFEHATGTPRRGTHHVIDQLANLGADDDPRRQVVMKAALLQMPIPSAAAAAAKWFASHPTEREQPVASEAFDYWLRQERPTPKSGVVPTSPRDDLLRGLLILSPKSVAALLEHWRDPRHGVRDVATAAYGRLIVEDSRAREDSLLSALAGDLPSDWLRLLVERQEHLSLPQKEVLLKCLDSEDPAVRLAVMPLLKSRDLSLSDCRSRLEVLRKDPVNEVRERAAKMLRAPREMQSDR
jgi:hypothetical protein